MVKGLFQTALKGHEASLPRAIETFFAKIIPGKTVVTVQSHRAEGASLHLARRMRQKSWPLSIHCKIHPKFKHVLSFFRSSYVSCCFYFFSLCLIEIHPVHLCSCYVPTVLTPDSRTVFHKNAPTPNTMEIHAKAEGHT